MRSLIDSFYETSMMSEEPEFRLQVRRDSLGSTSIALIHPRAPSCITCASPSAPAPHKTLNPALTPPTHVSISPQLSPANPDFGVICQGFIYGLTVSVKNSGIKPERLRVFCTPAPGSLNQVTCTYEPVRLAAGMSTDIQIKIEARHLCVSSTTLRVVQASTQVENSWQVKATVVPIEMYQNVTKGIKMKGQRITADRVKALGQIPGQAEAMIADAASSGAHGNQFSKAFMNDDEVVEIEMFPFVDCVYYDPWEKKMKVALYMHTRSTTLTLRSNQPPTPSLPPPSTLTPSCLCLCLCVYLYQVDETMLNVEVDTSWTEEQSKASTVKKWVKRLTELEDRGMFTARTADKHGNESSGEALMASNSRQNSPAAKMFASGASGYGGGGDGADSADGGLGSTGEGISFVLEGSLVA